MSQPVTLTQEHFLDLAKSACQELNGTWNFCLEQLLTFGFGVPTSLPKKGGKELLLSASEDDIRAYLKKYIGGYIAERQRKIILKQVATTPDPAVDEVLNAFEGIQPEAFAEITKLHRLSMAAENLIGTLLEHYLAERLENHGWVWACGETLRAIDFLLPGEPPVLLQVKNRSNSENSSSSAIRLGTDIKKWYRIKAESGQTNWEKLQKDTGVIVSEEDFYAFIRRTALASSKS